MFETGRSVVVGKDEKEIEWFRRQHGRCVIKFKGIDTISEVERYIGSEIRIASETLPEVEEGWFYTFQLKGCGVFTTEGEYIGEVTDVLDAGGSSVLKVDKGKEETLIPFAQEYLQTVDLDQRKIVVELPEGLRDLNK